MEKIGSIITVFCVIGLCLLCQNLWYQLALIGAPNSFIYRSPHTLESQHFWVNTYYLSWVMLHLFLSLENRCKAHLRSVLLSILLLHHYEILNTLHLYLQLWQPRWYKYFVWAKNGKWPFSLRGLVSIWRLPQ